MDLTETGKHIALRTRFMQFAERGHGRDSTDRDIYRHSLEMSKSKGDEPDG